ncbi:hypothetical protein CYLTODRAFT_66352 [Cylindrobasidium torrendii FP15055 ss-10]|uniref:Uncharacterized protein n=1 Tax=Cylindrobasidium torrendii FP15055 ss-10 TaxID=1314674 RepID=A0A0D7B571_9AGAR|nr:hypothetical protein CYLTODRAFT_66352 [Cylindrobasidium torrendii FP15055 ss-10]
MSALVNGVMMLMDDAESNDADDDKAFGPSSWTHNVPAQTRDVVNDFSHTDTDVDSFFAFDQASSSSPSSVFVFEATPPQAPYANDRRDPFVDMDVLPKDTLSVTDNLWTTPRQFTPRNLRTMSSREARLAAQASRPGPEDPQLRFSQTDLDMVDHSQNLRGPFREAMKGYRRQLAEAGEEVSDWEDSSIDDAASFDEEFGVPRMVEPLPPREDRMTAPLPRRALREG